jgi:hypothetical protein
VTRTSDRSLEVAVQALLESWFPDKRPTSFEEWRDIAYKDATTTLAGLRDAGYRVLRKEEMAELHVLQGGERLWTHNTKDCDPVVPCCIHNPSKHHMVTWPMHWRDARAIMERICAHGVGHPDPDDAAYRAGRGDTDTVHGCDGCCAPPQLIPSQATGSASATQDAVSG